MWIGFLPARSRLPPLMIRSHPCPIPDAFIISRWLFGWRAAIHRCNSSRSKSKPAGALLRHPLAHREWRT